MINYKKNIRLSIIPYLSVIPLIVFGCWGIFMFYLLGGLTIFLNKIILAPLSVLSVGVILLILLNPKNVEITVSSQNITVFYKVILFGKLIVKRTYRIMWEDFYKADMRIMLGKNYYFYYRQDGKYKIFILNFFIKNRDQAAKLIDVHLPNDIKSKSFLKNVTERKWDT